MMIFCYLRKHQTALIITTPATMDVMEAMISFRHNTTGHTNPNEALEVRWRLPSGGRDPLGDGPL
jgi:hypothetical protein